MLSFLKVFMAYYETNICKLFMSNKCRNAVNVIIKVWIKCYVDAEKEMAELPMRHRWLLRVDSI